MSRAARSTSARDLLARWRADRMLFRKEAVVLEDGRLLGEAMEAWQLEDFRGLDTHRHGFLERSRGHSKTADAGTEILADLVIGPPNSLLYGVAADEDQGRLLRDDVQGKFERSPILRSLARYTRTEIVVPSTGSRFKIMSSDGPSAYGLRPDRVYVDELTEHRGRGIWDAMWSATGKRPGCKVIALSTAGWDKTAVAWEVRQLAEREANWYFSTRGQCASWIDPEWLAQQQRTLPPHVFARLHLNRWVEGAGAFLLAVEVDRIFATGLRAGDGPRAIGLDIGLTHDKTVACVLRANGAVGGAEIEALLTWAPRSGERVDLQGVEDEVGRLARELRCPVCLDPWQAVLLSQRLRASGVTTIEYPFTSTSRRQLFATLLDLIRAGGLRSHPHDDLRRELLGLEVQESTMGGWRVDHRPGHHDDHVVAVALALAGLAGPDTREPTDEDLEMEQGGNFLLDMDAALDYETRRQRFLETF